MAPCIYLHKYFLHREQGRTCWPLSDSLWSVCARPLGAFPSTLFKVSGSKGRTQGTEFAVYVPAASTCVEALVEQRELGFGAQMLTHMFSSCVTLSCCLIPSSSQSLCYSYVPKYALFCEDPTSPVWLMVRNTYSITLSSPGLSPVSLITKYGKYCLGNRKEESRTPGMKIRFYMCLDDYCVGLWYICSTCYSGLYPWPLIFLCTSVIEQPEFRLHYFLKKKIVAIFTCDAFWQYTKSSFHWKIAVLTQQPKFSACNLDSFLPNIVQQINSQEQRCRRKKSLAQSICNIVCILGKLTSSSSFLIMKIQ